MKHKGLRPMPVSFNWHDGMGEKKEEKKGEGEKV